MNENFKNNKSNDTEEIAKRELNSLIKISATAYTIHGYAPAGSFWRFSEHDLKKIIRDEVASYLDKTDIQVDLDINYNNGSIYAFVWVPSTSKHVCSTDLQTSKAAINCNMKRYSPQLKEFMKKFCAKNEQRTFKAEGNDKWVGMRVLLNHFLDIECDKTGYSFGKKYGEEFKKKMSLTFTAHFAKNENGGYGKFQYVEATKSIRYAFDKQSLRPRRSHNVR